MVNMVDQSIYLKTVIILILSSTTLGFSFDKTFLRNSDNELPYGEPLFLSQYIQSGEIEKARQLSHVKGPPNAPALSSYSGFLTVNETYNSNIFFWFVPAMDNNKRAPVILWLQGGPGTSGLFGFFLEHGPYEIFPNMTAGIREYTWANNFHMLYVDNPVGAGFSFTDDPKGYVTNQDEMAEDMYEFLQQFFTMFYEYRNNDFYIAGESYAGKYVPALAYKIHTEGKSSDMNLKGIAIGNGMCDPETMMDYSDYLYQLGLIDRNQAVVMRNLSNLIIKHIRDKEYYKALVEMDKLIINYDVFIYPSYFQNYTDFHFYYNLLLSRTPGDFGYYKRYVNLPQFRKAIHVGNLTFQDGKMALKYLFMDIMQSVKPKVEVLLDNYRVLFYNGQLDLLIPYPLTVNFLHNVTWKYAKEYKASKRQIWKLKKTGGVVGYVHSVKDFYEVLVRDAGHIVPYDQPKVAFDMISRFVNGKSFS